MSEEYSVLNFGDAPDPADAEIGDLREEVARLRGEQEYWRRGCEERDNNIARLLRKIARLRGELSRSAVREILEGRCKEDSPLSDAAQEVLEAANRVNGGGAQELLDLCEANDLYRALLEGREEG